MARRHAPWLEHPARAQDVVAALRRSEDLDRIDADAAEQGAQRGAAVEEEMARLLEAAPALGEVAMAEAVDVRRDDHEAPARPQDPPAFGEKADRLLHVLEHVAGGDRVERPVGIGDGGELADVDRDAVLRPGGIAPPADRTRCRGRSSRAPASPRRRRRCRSRRRAACPAACRRDRPRHGGGVRHRAGAAGRPSGRAGRRSRRTACGVGARAVRRRRGVVAVVGPADVLGDQHRVLPDEAAARIGAALQRPAARHVEDVVRDRCVQHVSGRAAEQAARPRRGAQRGGRRAGAAASITAARSIPVPSRRRSRAAERPARRGRGRSR